MLFKNKIINLIQIENYVQYKHSNNNGNTQLYRADIISTSKQNVALTISYNLLYCL